jgi:hypothetical protein
MVTSPADVAAELMATFGIEQVSYSRRRGKLGELETHCVQTIENLVEKFGREPVYWALWVITETKHRALLVHPVVTALVETLATYPKWRDQIGSLADALDEIDLPAIAEIAAANQAIVPKKHMVAALLYERFLLHLGSPRKAEVPIPASVPNERMIVLPGQFALPFEWEA